MPAAATVTLGEARREAAARAARLVTVLAPLWKAARRWTSALVLAAFPFLFIADGPVHWPVSPVLPGLLVLALLLVGLPFLLVEAATRRYARKEHAWQVRHAGRALQLANAALLVAALWLVGWFAVGT